MESVLFGCHWALPGFTEFFFLYLLKIDAWGFDLGIFLVVFVKLITPDLARGFPSTARDVHVGRLSAERDGRRQPPLPAWLCGRCGERRPPARRAGALAGHRRHLRQRLLRPLPWRRRSAPVVGRLRPVLRVRPQVFYRVSRILSSFFNQPRRELIGFFYFSWWEKKTVEM